MSEMSQRKSNSALTSALEAVADLCEDALAKLDHSSGLHAISAHSEIKRTSIDQKSAIFYRSLVPLRTEMIAVLAASYRRYFKLALAHPSQTGGDPTTWAWIQLQPAVHAALEWMSDWYVFACEGESRRMRPVASFQFEPGKTVSTPIPNPFAPFPPVAAWRAPAWLFQVSLVLVGIGVVKTEHVPSKESVERLGPGHTRLILKGAKRVFLWNLGEVVERVRNEEIAAAGAIPAATIGGQTEEPSKQKGSKSLLKGIDGLGPKKTDFSQYMHNLTEKQQLAFSLKFEYELGLAEIASRMGLDRKTAYEHIEAAKRKINQARSNEKSKAHRTKSEDQ
jgi:predicted DNA-binding protein (UPF0251 family)